MAIVLPPPSWRPKLAIPAAMSSPTLALAVKVFEQFSELQFDRPYGGADMVDDLGAFLRQHRRIAIKLTQDAPGSDVAANAVRSLYKTFASLASDGDEPVGGGDTVQAMCEWVARWQPALADILGDGFRPKVAVHEEKDEDEEDVVVRSYWSLDGWTRELDDACAFFYDVPDLHTVTKEKWSIADLAELRAERDASEPEPRPYFPRG